MQNASSKIAAILLVCKRVEFEFIIIAIRNEYFLRFLGQKKCDELDGVSPTYVILTEASKDLDKFKKLVVGHSKNEKRDLINDLQYHHGLSDSILRYLATDKDPEIREYVVRVTKDESIIKLLAKDQDEKVRGAVPFRTKDESILKELTLLNFNLYHIFEINNI